MNRNFTIPNNPYNQKHPHHHHRQQRNFSLYSPKLSLFLLAACAALFILFQTQSLHAPSPQEPPPSTSSDCRRELAAAAARLRDSVTFLPLKDLRYAGAEALRGHTWFMSSLYDQHEEGEVQFQHFPSANSAGRLLCLRGRDNHDGSWNSYALAWPGSLPENASLVKGLTFVSYNHYNYDNIWHGLSAMVPFVAWHIKNACSRLPDRWVLYHWGELRTKMGPWVRSLMEATFDGSVDIERFDSDDDDGDGAGESTPASCFEEAVVMRHNEGGMSRQRRIEVYDLMRCKAREYCNVTAAEGGATGAPGGGEERPAIGMTMLMRTGPRSFRNESAVIRIFERECRKVEGCRLTVAHSNNLTFCEQVKLMSLTDILISPHGAQLTNMFLMDRNSSVMEFFPKGWLKLAGVGQYVHHWIASWSGMVHQGAWRDPTGDRCPYGNDDDHRCMSMFKNGKIGQNETYFAEWAGRVLQEVKARKVETAFKQEASFGGCTCRSSL
ncbi:hypothetical protein NMG60_11019018 [Bertholletia excelsa]